MPARLLARLLVALVAASVLFASVTPASARAASSATTAPTAYSKPLVTHHADRAPSVPGSTAPQTAVPGSPGPEAAVPRADGSGSGSTHALAPLLSGGGGTNSISFAQFVSGDIVVVLDPLSLTGHAGLFDRRFYSNGIMSYAVISANVAPANGVQREQCVKYRNNDKAWGLWVPSEANHTGAARDFAYRQMGKPYNVLASKTDLRSFYCSKLVWAAWRYTAGVDLDYDGGYWVWPVDLINSSHTRVFGYWS